MGKLLRITAVFFLAALFGFWCMMKKECFYTDKNRFALLESYLHRAYDPHEKQLRLAETKRAVSSGVQGKRSLTTLKFVDEKYYLNTFSKTFKMVITREAGVDRPDHDWIDASLFLDIDYGVRTDHEVIFSLSRVGRKDTLWGVLSSLYENPVHSVRKKLPGSSPDSM